MKSAKFLFIFFIASIFKISAKILSSHKELIVESELISNATIEDCFASNKHGWGIGEEIVRLALVDEIIALEEYKGYNRLYINR